MTNKQMIEIIAKLADDKDLLAAFLDMQTAVKEASEGEDIIYMYAIEKTTEDGKKHYHPVVTTNTLFPSMAPEEYFMMVSTDIIALQNDNQEMIELMQAEGESPVIIKVTAETYTDLEEKLCKYVSTVVCKVEEATSGIDVLRDVVGDDAIDDMHENMQKNILCRVMALVPTKGAYLTEDMQVGTKEVKYEEPREEVEDDENIDDDYFLEDTDFY